MKRNVWVLDTPGRLTWSEKGGWSNGWDIASPDGGMDSNSIVQIIGLLLK